jgi:hypothetical protein
MRWKRELNFIIRRLIYRRRAELELDEEIRAHLEMEIERNIADGMSPEEARLAARLKSNQALLTLLLRETVNCPGRHSSCFLKPEGSRCFGSEIFPD